MLKFGADVMVAERGQVGKGVKKNPEQIWPYLCRIRFNFPSTSVFSFFLIPIAEANVCNTVGLVRVDGDLLGSLRLVRVDL